MVGLQTLDLPIMVRIHVPQPLESVRKRNFAGTLSYVPEVKRRGFDGARYRFQQKRYNGP